MQPIKDMTAEQVRAIKLAYPRSMTPILSWQMDCEREALEARRSDIRRREIERLADRLAGDFIGSALTAETARIIISRVLDHLRDE